MINKIIIPIIMVFFPFCAIAIDDNLVSSAYKFKKCYEFQFNQSFLSKDVQYNLIDNSTSLSISNGIINRDNPGFIFCSDYNFENKTPTQTGWSEYHPYNYFTNGIITDKQDVDKSFKLILKYKTKFGVNEYDLLTLDASDKFNFTARGLGTRLDTAIHNSKLMLEASPNIFINNVSNPKVQANMSVNFRMFSPEFVSNDYGIYPAEIYDLNEWRESAEFMTADGWAVLRCNKIFGCNTGSAIHDYENTFIPRIFSASELITFYVSFDTNQYKLSDPFKTKLVQDITIPPLDYKNAKADERISMKTKRNDVVTINYQGRYNKQETLDTLIQPFTLFAQDKYPFCGAFDYNETSGLITGYCQVENNFGNNLLSMYKKVQFNLKQCNTPAISIINNEPFCADSHISAHPYIKKDYHADCPVKNDGLFGYILTGVSHGNLTVSDNNLCRYNPYGLNKSVTTVLDEKYVSIRTKVDWAVNWTKRECPKSSVAVGLGWDNGKPFIRCADSKKDINLGNTCKVHWFNRSDYGYTPHPDTGDFSPNVYKGEVNEGSYIAGIAFGGVDDGSPNAFLECTLQ